MSVKSTLFAKSFCVAGGVIAAAWMLVAAGTPAARAAGGDEWQRYSDPKFHIAIERPAGWEVQVDSNSILVHSADNATFALVESFENGNDDTAEDHVDSMPSSDARFFHGAHVDDAYSRPVQGGNGKDEEGIGVLSFQGAQGPGEARVLCRVFGKGGLVFAIAAPKGQLTEARSTLVRIIQSVRLGSAGGAGGRSRPDSGGEESEPAAVSAGAPAPGLDPLTNIKYKPWTDPKEGAISYDIPVGWKVDGGTYRYEPLDYRQSIIVRSPHDEMAIMIGDAALPSFTLPSFAWTRLGYRDGAVQQVVGKPRFFMHYMSAEEFNQWYCDNYLSKSVDDLQIGQVIQHPDVADKLMDMAKHQPGLHGQIVDSAASTLFTGRSKLNGRQIGGNIVTLTSEFLGNAQGDGNWTAHPTLIVWATGDNKADARKAAVAAILKHMNQSFRMSQKWMAEQIKRGNAFLAANQIATNNALAIGRANMASMARSHQAYMSAQDDRRTSMMGSFRAQMAAKDNMKRKMQNYSLDQTDVTNGSSSWKVPSGYNNYYHDAKNGVIVGTNDQSNQGPDLAPLSQY